MLVVAVLPVLGPEELIEVVVSLRLGLLLLLGLGVVSVGLQLFLEVVELVPVLAGVVVLLFEEVDDVPEAHGVGRVAEGAVGEQGIEAGVDVGADVDDVALDEVDEGLHDVVLDLLGLPGAVLV